MLTVSISFFIAYIFALGIIVSLGFTKQRIREDKYITEKEKINPNEIVVLIPFRNEELRINGLLTSIKRLSVKPKSFVFIDDHSEDRSIQIIKEALGDEGYTILQLPEEVTGKKRALRFATDRTQSDYILTIDADVELPADYFERIAKYGVADMYVLPAIMIPQRWYEHFYEIDLLLVTAANAGLAGLKRPIMASGANLLYKRSTFERVDNIESHIHAASGDDTYLLRDYRNAAADVRLLTDPDCAIKTETPQSFKEFIDQRLRWIGKTADIKDNLSTSLAVIQALLTVFFLGLLGYYVATFSWANLLIIFLLKTVVDLALFMPYFLRLKRLTSLFFIPAYEILFPIYTILISVLLFSYKPKWKGRSIYEKRRP